MHCTNTRILIPNLLLTVNIFKNMVFSFLKSDPHILISFQGTFQRKENEAKFADEMKDFETRTWNHDSPNSIPDMRLKKSPTSNP